MVSCSMDLRSLLQKAVTFPSLHVFVGPDLRIRAQSHSHRRDNSIAFLISPPFLLWNVFCLVRSSFIRSIFTLEGGIPQPQETNDPGPQSASGGASGQWADFRSSKDPKIDLQNPNPPLAEASGNFPSTLKQRVRSGAASPATQSNSPARFSMLTQQAPATRRAGSPSGPGTENPKLSINQPPLHSRSISSERRKSKPRG